MENPVFLVAGGDMRQVYLAEMLADKGYRVNIWGFDKISVPDAVNYSDFYEALSVSDILILPLPFSQDGIHINTPLGNSSLSIHSLIYHITEKTTVFGGRLSKNFSEQLADRDVKVFDYFENEELTVKNVIPTAEGAIAIAMDNTEVTLHGSECLVAGYGRIGKVLSRKLAALEAHVSVSARKKSDIAWIYSAGHDFVSYSEFPVKLGRFDIIINTVPALIFDKETLSYANPRALIIDLASKPGGVDFAAAKEMGIRAIQALSLPGKVAPVTSGRIIMETILSLMSK